jgi:hypothetical protein
VLLVIDRMLNRVGKAAHDAAALQPSNLGRAREFLIRGLGEMRAITVLFTDDTAADRAVHDLVASHFSYAAHVFEGIIRSGQDAGEFAPGDPTLIAEVVRAGTESLLNPAVLRASKKTYVEALEDFFAFVSRGLTA